MTTRPKRAFGRKLVVSASGGYPGRTDREPTIAVRVTNEGRGPVRLDDVGLRIPHDTALRIVEMSLASSLEDGPPLPFELRPGASIGWSVPLRAVQGLIYRAAIAEDEGRAARLARPRRSLPAEARALVARLLDEPGRLPYGIRYLGRRLMNRPMRIVVRDDRGRRHRSEVRRSFPAHDHPPPAVSA